MRYRSKAHAAKLFNTQWWRLWVDRQSNNPGSYYPYPEWWIDQLLAEEAKDRKPIPYTVEQDNLDRYQAGEWGSDDDIPF